MMAENYVPELGQEVFGQPHKKFEVSRIVDAALCMIRDQLDIIMWNIEQRDCPSPFGNTGTSFKCDTFEVHAYSWGDDDQPFNFKWRDIEISWYKYLGRGMSANTDIAPDLAAEMLNDCLLALDRYQTSKRMDTLA
jgi:hypothetical protein